MVLQITSELSSDDARRIPNRSDASGRTVFTSRQLIIARSPPSTFPFSRLMLLKLVLVMLLHKAQNVEPLDLALRKEAVHRVLLLGEHFEHRRKLRQHQQLDIPPVQARQLQ